MKVIVRGKPAYLNEGCGSYILLIRELRSGLLRADDAKGPWEWAMAGIHGLISTVFLVSAFFMILGAFGYFPPRESGFGIGAIGVGCLIAGIWLGVGFIRLSLERSELVIRDGGYSLIEWIGGIRSKVIQKKVHPEDRLICHTNDDAEQDMFGVSLELELYALAPTTITLFKTSLRYENTPGKPTEEMIQAAWNKAATEAFDYAQKINNCTGIAISRE